ncbi:MAG: hypothetical protein ACT4NV_12085 [Rhodoferax sp.]
MTESLETLRRAAQLAFAASGQELLVGDPRNSPWPLPVLAALPPQDPAVQACFDGGLTARVLRLRSPDGRHWSLKQARRPALVRNVDGQTSFLNELQRRADIMQLQNADPQRWRCLAHTTVGSLHHGVLLSPWIAGQAVAGWNERSVQQVLQLAGALWLQGLFEWDLCAGNLLDDGAQVHLFDFGYQYRFDPLSQFNSAGNGTDLALFHPAERFETRCFCAHLLALEQGPGHGAALAAFRLEKTLALQVYQGLRDASRARGAQRHVLQWLEDILARWQGALNTSDDLRALYLAENWRSHCLDLHDDLSGQSCTPQTLQRADWLLCALAEHGSVLQSTGALLWDDASRSLAQLRSHYQELREQAQRYQIGTAAPTASAANGPGTVAGSALAHESVG